MNTKRKATAAVLFILMLTVVSVGVVVAHHNGLYLNYDSGKQKVQAGKENYAHLWWVQYDANMYWKADSPLRSDVMSAIDDWTAEIPELTWIERPSDYDIEFKLGDCPFSSSAPACVHGRTFSNDCWADANYQDTAQVWVQDRSDWGVGSRQAAISHELGHLYALHEGYNDSSRTCNGSRTTIMDGMKRNANNKIVHCDGLTGPNASDGNDVEDFYHTGDTGSMTASSSGTEATFTWKDQTWAEQEYEVKFFWWNQTEEEWELFTRRSRTRDVGVHVPTSSCSSSAGCDDRTLSETIDRVVYDTPAAWYIMCGWPYFEKYRDHGTWRYSPIVYVN